MKINREAEFLGPSLLIAGICGGFVVGGVGLLQCQRTHLGPLHPQARDAQVSACRRANLGYVDMAVFPQAFINEIFTVDQK